MASGVLRERRIVLRGLGLCKIVRVLEVQPELRRRAEAAAETDGRVGADIAARADDLGNAVRRNVDLFRKLAGAEPERDHELLVQNLSRVGTDARHRRSPSNGLRPMFMGSGLAPLARPGMTLWRERRDRDPGAFELRPQHPRRRDRRRLVAVDADGVDLDRDGLAADRLEALR